MQTTALPRLLAAAFVLALVAPASAQDAAKVNGKYITVKLDNARVRVFESTLAPGDREQMHSHPASVVYIITGGVVRNHTPDGKTSEATLKAGDVMYREPLTHWAENIGTTTIRLTVTELKPAP